MAAGGPRGGPGRGPPGPGAVGRALRGPDGGAGAPPQLADPDERGPGGGPARGLLRAPGRRRPGLHLRRAEVGGPHPPVRGRHRLLLLAPAAERGPGAQDARGGERPPVVHPHLRRRHRDHQAGRGAPRGQHGRAAGGPPRRGRLRGGEARAWPLQLQRVGGGHRRLPGGGGGRPALHAASSAGRGGGGAGGRGGAARPHRLGGLGLGRAGPALPRPRRGGQPHPRPGPLRGGEPVRRAAAPPLRGLHAGLRQPGPLRPGRARGRGRLGGARRLRARRRALPRRRAAA